MARRRRRRLHRRATWSAACSTDEAVEHVTVYDNFSSGRRWHLEAVADDPRLEVVEGEVDDLERSPRRMDGHDAVVHLASNPDIAKAMTDPTSTSTRARCSPTASSRPRAGPRPARPLRVGERRVRRPRRHRGRRAPRPARPGLDLRREQARRRGADRRLLPHVRAAGRAFRFGNVVGPNQTHGVGFDFVRSCSPTRPDSRSSATARRASPTSTSTTSSPPSSSPRRRATSRSRSSTSPPATTSPSPRSPGSPSSASTRSAAVALDYTGGDRGWKGDVPVVRIATDRIRGLGWTPDALHARGAPRVDARCSLDAMRAGDCDARRAAGGVPRPRRRARAGARGRDGTPLPVRDVGEVVLVPASRRLRRFATPAASLVVVTNQPDIARARSPRAGRRINARSPSLPITESCVCPHDDADGCACRKPLPGMLLDAAEPGSTSRRARWSATAGATSRPAAPPAPGLSSSTAIRGAAVGAPEPMRPSLAAAAPGPSQQA